MPAKGRKQCHHDSFRSSRCWRWPPAAAAAAAATPPRAAPLRRTYRCSSTGKSDLMIAVGAVVALWSLSGAMQTVMWSLNAAHECPETRGFVRKRLVARLMILVSLLAVGLVVFMLVLGPAISSWLQDQTGVAAVSWLWDYGRWPLLALGLLFVCGGVLYLGPDLDHGQFRLITPGAVLASSAWLIACRRFAIYAGRFGGYNKVWGSLAAVIVTMIWLWLSSLALLVGAELDAELKRVHGSPEAGTV